MDINEESMSKKITLEYKENTCKLCGNADKRVLRQHRSGHCQALEKTGRSPRLRNGHCTEFESIKPKSRQKAGAEA